MVDKRGTERTLRHMARELAERFYEGKRSGEFRSSNALVTAYQTVMDRDGRMFEQMVKVPFVTAYPNARAYAAAHWPHFYDLARKCAIGLLGQPDSKVSPHLKESVFKALKEDRDRQQRYGGLQLLQVKSENLDGQAK